MRNMTKWMIVPALALAAACSKSDKNTRADSALSTDLSMAGQQQPLGPQFVSPAEQANARGTVRPTVSGTGSSTVRRSTTSSAPRRTSSATRTVYTQSAPAPAPAPVVVKHTQRDAAIGAAAGAVIGATTSKNKVKGAVIGGVAGGILGAVIGNNVDKTKK